MNIAARRHPLRAACRWLRWPLVLYLLLLLTMMIFEESLIFMPTRYPHGEWQPYGFAAEDAWIETPDGLRIHGWYVPHEQPQAVVLLAHGNGGNITHRDDLLRGLHRLRASTLIFDYRGYGRSEGTPNESGVLTDARAARRWLARRTGVEEPDIVLFGESLGGGVQVDLAAREGARGLVLLKTFNSLPDVAAFHYPWLPVRWVMRTRLDSAAKIGSYRGPLLQLHGDRDSIVPLEFGRKLFAAAREPKEFVLLPGEDHNDPAGEQTFAAIDRFLAALPTAGAETIPGAGD